MYQSSTIPPPTCISQKKKKRRRREGKKKECKTTITNNPQEKRTFIPRNNQSRISLKITIDILKGPVRRLRVEEVNDRNETEADTGPDDPEAPAEIGDAGGCYLDDHVVL